MSVRLRRLYAEHERLKVLFGDHPRIRIVEAIGDPPDRYVIEYYVKGLTETREGIRESHLHRVQITLGPNYPKEMASFVVLGTPVFHPNIDHLAVCTEDTSSADRTLVDAIVFIGRLITFQAFNLQSPRNGDAKQWTEANLDRLPLETVDLMPTGLVTGVTLPVPAMDARADTSATDDPPTQPIIMRPPALAASPAPAVARCTNCGRSDADASIATCAGHHLACTDCMLPCEVCGTTLCVLCDIGRCSDCARHLCGGCSTACHGCAQVVCQAHAFRCRTCGAMSCARCSKSCSGCGGVFCSRHVDETGCCDACRATVVPPGARLVAAAVPPGPPARAPRQVAVEPWPAGPSRQLATFPAVQLAYQPEPPSVPARPEPAWTPVRDPPREPVRPGPVASIVITPDEALSVFESMLQPPSLQRHLTPNAGPLWSGKAIASLVFGIAGLPIMGLLVGWFAVWFGVMALRDVGRQEGLRGRGLAISGLSLGVIDIALWVILLALYGATLFSERFNAVPRGI